MDDASPQLASRREVGKAERRRRIVDAAAALMREAGLEAVSMVQIAERAEVSPATLYNLFQTKGAIFHQVFDLDLEDYRTEVASAPAANALERIFVGVDVAAEHYRRDPVFYRAMMRGGGHGQEGLVGAISEPRIAFLQDQVAAAVADGSLTAEADARIVGVALSQLMRGVIVEWALGAITADRLAHEAAYGFALLLQPYAAAATAPALRSRIVRLQAELARGRTR